MAATLAVTLAATLAGCCARGRVVAPTVLGRGALVYALATAADGALLAVELADSFELVRRDPVTLATRARLRLGAAEHDVVALAAASDGAVYWASEDGWVRGAGADLAGDDGADLAGGGRANAATPRIGFALGAPATAVAASPDGRWLATGDDRGVVCLRRRVDGALLQCAALHDARVAALAFSAAGTLASAGWDGQVFLWAVPSLTVVARVAGDAATALAFAADGRALAIGRAATPPRRSPDSEQRRSDSSLGNGGVEVIGPDGARRWWRADAHRGPTTALAWDGASLLSGGWDGRVRRWDLARTPSVELHRGDAAVTALAVTRAGIVVGVWASRLPEPSLILLRRPLPSSATSQ